MRLVDYSLSSDDEGGIDNDDDEMYAWFTPEQYDGMFGAGKSDALFAEKAELPLDHFYDLTCESVGYSKTFKTKTSEFTLSFQNLDEVDDLENKVTSVLDLVLDKNESKAGSLLGLTIRHPAMDSDFLIPFTQRENLTGRMVFTYMEKLLQSNKEISLDSAFKITLVQVIPPQGFGNRYKKIRLMSDFDEYRKGRTGHGGTFITIKNKDNLCCARALVVARAKIDNDPRWNSIRKDRKLQKDLAIELTNHAGLSANTGGCGVVELEKFQKALSPQYQIKVYSKDLYNELLFKGPPAEKHLCLYLADNHYDVITTLPGFVGSSYYCHSCEKGYDNTDTHNCSATCPSCRKPGICPPSPQPLYCEKCHRYFQNDRCFSNHTATSKVHNKDGESIETSVCKRLKRCHTCNVQYQTQSEHKCGVAYCKFCQTKADKKDHLCYMQPYRKVPKDKRETLIFFDFETSQEKIVMDTPQTRSFEHRVVACVVQKICSSCRDSDLGECQYCGKNEMIFTGPNTTQEFCKWLFSPKNYDSTAFAHNGKAFDSQFILKYLHTQALKPQIIMRGRSILSLTVGKIRIVDSLSFLPWSLAQFPKAFNLTELKKGYFPHHFTRTENWDYIGPFPDASYYDPEHMRPEQRDEFLKWYKETNGKIFNFQKELIEYCKSDVDILRRGCLTFQRDFTEMTGHNPFETAITIAQAVHEVYRKKFLPPQKIALLPYHGYRPGDKFSKIAIKWIKWLSHTRKIRIHHGLNGGEVKIGPFKVDGLSESTVLEFNGCAFHGCPSCYPDPNLKLPLSGMTAGEAYQRTLDRKRYLIKMGYQVEELWECGLKNQLRQNPEMKTFFGDILQIDPLQPRDAFFGGRTNAIRLYHEVKPGEKIRYVDVCSLYPWVCKTGVFPIGHPTIITEEFQNLADEPYQGLIKCTVLPPRTLFHPLLPMKHKDKLCFVLCRSCLVENAVEGCYHTDEERKITGTWVSLEVYKAIKLGYSVLKVHEVWNFEQSSQYDGTNESECLFVSYINCFLKRKTEASGYPSNVKSEDEKAQFVTDYEKHEGIQLEPSNIKRNSSYRQVTKLSLNSLWGKLAQRQNLEKTEYFSDPMSFFKCVFDPSHVISGVRIISDKLAIVHYSTHEDFIGIQPNKNVVIAAYVTAQARLKLYSYLETLQDRVLYMDTDSVIYLTRPGDIHDLPTGPYLGDLTNELDDYGPNAFITEFVSGGAKNYGYKVHDPDTGLNRYVVKVKGINVTTEVSKLLNFDTMKEKVKIFVKSGCQEKIKVIIRKFIRDRFHSVTTVYSPKLYQVVYDKRVVMKDYNTVPFGYRYIEMYKYELERNDSS